MRRVGRFEFQRDPAVACGARLDRVHVGSQQAGPSRAGLGVIVRAGGAPVRRQADAFGKVGEAGGIAAVHQADDGIEPLHVERVLAPPCRLRVTGFLLPEIAEIPAVGGGYDQLVHHGIGLFGDHHDAGEIVRRILLLSQDGQAELVDQRMAQLVVQDENGIAEDEKVRFLPLLRA